MSDTVVEFFDALARATHEPLLAKVTGTVRFDLKDGDRVEHWRVAVDRGAVTVSQDAGVADCTAAADRAFFERLCRGEENAMASVLRGALTCTGDVELLLAIQRLFPARATEPASSGGDLGG